MFDSPPQVLRHQQCSFASLTPRKGHALQAPSAAREHRRPRATAWEMGLGAGYSRPSGRAAAGGGMGRRHAISRGILPQAPQLASDSAARPIGMPCRNVAQASISGNFSRPRARRFQTNTCRERGLFHTFFSRLAADCDRSVRLRWPEANKVKVVACTNCKNSPWQPPVRGGWLPLKVRIECCTAF